MELDLDGGEYTWEKSRGTPNWVREILDEHLLLVSGGINCMHVSYLLFRIRVQTTIL